MFKLQLTQLSVRVEGRIGNMTVSAWSQFAPEDEKTIITFGKPDEHSEDEIPAEELREVIVKALQDVLVAAIQKVLRGVNETIANMMEG